MSHYGKAALSGTAENSLCSTSEQSKAKSHAHAPHAGTYAGNGNRQDCTGVNVFDLAAMATNTGCTDQRVCHCKQYTDNHESTKKQATTQGMIMQGMIRQRALGC